MHEILLDHISFVTQTNDKVVETELAIDFHDMPKYGLAANIDHWLRP
jgi:hypothetical protein